MTHPLLLCCLSEKPIWYIYVVIPHKLWLYTQFVVIRLVILLMRQHFFLMRQHLTRKTQESTTVVIWFISWLCVVIYYICTEKMPEPSGDGFMWLYDQRRGYTPQFVVIRLAVLPMRQHLTSKTQEWLCVHDRGYTSHIVFMRGYILHVYREGPRTT